MVEVSLPRGPSIPPDDIYSSKSEDPPPPDLLADEPRVPHPLLGQVRREAGRRKSISNWQTERIVSMWYLPRGIKFQSLVARGCRCHSKPGTPYAFFYLINALRLDERCTGLHRRCCNSDRCHTRSVHQPLLNTLPSTTGALPLPQLISHAYHLPEDACQHGMLGLQVSSGWARPPSDLDHADAFRGSCPGLVKWQVLVVSLHWFLAIEVDDLFFFRRNAPPRLHAVCDAQSWRSTSACMWG